MRPSMKRAHFWTKSLASRLNRPRRRAGARTGSGSTRSMRRPTTSGRRISDIDHHPYMPFLPFLSCPASKRSTVQHLTTIKAIVHYVYCNKLYCMTQPIYNIPILSSWTSNVGSVVEFSPATREARVRFPDVAILFFFVTFNYCD